MSEPVFNAIMIKTVDNVATALSEIPSGIRMELSCQGQIFTVEMADNIEFGHKFAVKPIANGHDIIKYGEVIGVAIRDINPGQHVHVHNLEGKRGRGDRIGKPR